MKECLLLGASLILAACASNAPQPRLAGGNAAASDHAYFCRADRLRTYPDRFVCNWEHDAHAACWSDRVRSLEVVDRKNRLVEPRYFLKCPNSGAVVAFEIW